MRAYKCAVADPCATPAMSSSEYAAPHCRRPDQNQTQPHPSPLSRANQSNRPILLAQTLAYVKGEPVYTRVTRLRSGEMECVPEILAYTCRPDELQDLDLYTFTAKYELTALPKGRGRPSNIVLRLLPSHPKADEKGIRKRKSVWIPLAVGRRLGDRLALGFRTTVGNGTGDLLRPAETDDGAADAAAAVAAEPASEASADRIEEYASTALLLFRPWRTIDDLLRGHTTFTDAAAEYTPSKLASAYLTNAQAHHDGRRAATLQRSLLPDVSVGDAPREAASGADITTQPTEEDGDEMLSRLRTSNEKARPTREDEERIARLFHFGWAPPEPPATPPSPAHGGHPRDACSQWSAALRDVNAAQSPPSSTSTPSPPSSSSSSMYRGVRPMRVLPYRQAIQDRLRSRRPRASGAPSAADVAAYYRSLPDPPTIKQASDLCALNETQHMQFTLLALVVLREGAERSRLSDSETMAPGWQDLITEINDIIGSQPVHLWSQGLAGAPMAVPSRACFVIRTPCSPSSPTHSCYSSDART